MPNFPKLWVFAGGGPKGAHYPDALLALKDYLVEVEAFAGSSAGAINAALAATAMLPEEMSRVLKTLNLQELLGDASTSFSLLEKSGTPLRQFLAKQIKQNILTAIAAYDLKVESSPKGSTLAGNFDQILKDCHCEDAEITFYQLNILHQLWPGIFKHLVITTTFKSGGDLKIFSTYNVEHSSIAEVTMASAALPILIKPVKIKDYWQSEFVDGGFVDNVPVKPEYFVSDGQDLTVTMKKEIQRQILAFVFRDGDIETFSYTKSAMKAVKATIADHVLPLFYGISTTKKHTVYEQELRERLEEIQENIIYIDSHIALTDFDGPQRTPLETSARGRLPVLFYLMKKRFIAAEPSIVMQLFIFQHLLQIRQQSSITFDEITHKKALALLHIIHQMHSATGSEENFLACMQTYLLTCCRQSGSQLYSADTLSTRSLIHIANELKPEENHIDRLIKHCLFNTLSLNGSHLSTKLTLQHFRNFVYSNALALTHHSRNTRPICPTERQTLSAIDEPKDDKEHQVLETVDKLNGSKDNLDRPPTTHIDTAPPDDLSPPHMHGRLKPPTNLSHTDSGFNDMTRNLTLQMEDEDTEESKYYLSTHSSTLFTAQEPVSQDIQKAKRSNLGA